MYGAAGAGEAVYLPPLLCLHVHSDDGTAGPLLRNKEFGPESVFRGNEDIVWIDRRRGCVKCKNRSIKQHCENETIK